MQPGGVGQAKVEEELWRSTKKKNRKSGAGSNTEQPDTREKADLTKFPRFESFAGSKHGWVPLLEQYQEQLRTAWPTVKDGEPGRLFICDPDTWHAVPRAGAARR